MGKKFEYKRTRFDGGISDDIRLNTNNGFAFSSHFDTFNGRKKLTPYRDLEANETKSFDIINFAYANEDDNLYGLGVESGEIAKVYMKSGDVITSAWTEDNAIDTGSGSRANIFFIYKDYVYGMRAGTHIWRQGQLSGVATNTASWQAVTYSTTADPVHHPADDSAYFFADNSVYRLNDTTWDGEVLILPQSLKIVSATPYGNYLAIGCAPLQGQGDSVVYLWDRDSSLVTVSDSVNWGNEKLMVLGLVEGRLVGISESGSDATEIRNELVFRESLGGVASIFKTITLSDDYTYTLSKAKFQKNSKLYFALYTSTANGDWTGIWTIGRRTSSDPLAVTMAYKVDPDDTSKEISGFIIVGDHLFVAHGDGSVDRTNDQVSYTQTSILETEIFNDDMPHKTKQFKNITVTTDPMPADGQIVLKYRKDEETSWTTLFTNTTDDSIRQSILLQPHFKEIQFRVESTGGAEITGIFGHGEYIEDDI